MLGSHPVSDTFRQEPDDFPSPHDRQEELFIILTRSFSTAHQSAEQFLNSHRPSDDLHTVFNRLHFWRILAAVCNTTVTGPVRVLTRLVQALFSARANSLFHHEGGALSAARPPESACLQVSFDLLFVFLSLQAGWPAAITDNRKFTSSSNLAPALDFALRAVWSRTRTVKVVSGPLDGLSSGVVGVLSCTNV